jgi:Zn-dependent protease/predicted transcriptional regulator
MSLQITKIKGIPIRLHFTLIVVFFLIAWTLSASLMPEIHPSLTRTEYWIIGVFGAGTSFISILLHELAHSIVALKYGLKVRQIVLFIFGGASDIEEGDSSKDFHKEFKIAIVGPITSFVIAAILGLSWWILISIVHGAASSPPAIANTTNATLVIAEAILQYGAIINTMLGGFNLIPAFPLDGGRILRSALLRWKKDYDQSTKIAVRFGTAISYAFMAVGFITMFSGSFIGGMWLLFIGWFLNSGAQSYLEQHQISTALSGVYLKDIMNTGYVSVKPDITVNELLNNYFNVYRKSEFPVVLAGREEEDPTGNELLGAVTAKQALKVPEHSRDRIKVEEIMVPKEELIVMRSTRPADDALRLMFRENQSRLFVCEENEEVKKQRGQKLLGLVSKTDILNVAKEREEFDKAVKKLSVSSNNNEVTTDSRGSNFGKTKITSSSISSSSYSYPPSHNKNKKFNVISRWRFLFFVFGIIVFITAYFVGATLVKINASQADFIKKDFETKIKGINQFGIFANNFKVALGMFIPGFGIALGGFSAFSTGLVFNAIAQTSPALSNISPLIVFLTPFGILEIIAYGIAISRSGILSYQLIKDTNKRNSWRKYVIPTIIDIGIVVTILFIGAMVEWQMIRTLGI